MKILILTPIPIEYNKVRAQLIAPTIEAVQHAGVQYEIGKFKGRFHDFEIIIHQTGSKNTEVALATEKAIQQFKPAIAILTGIAGGVKDVKIGDVVLANKMYGYESGKETDDGFVARPEVFNCSLDLVAHARKIGQSNSWKSRSIFSEKSNVFTGPIISGDKVISSTESVVYKRLKRHFNDTLALEMEASGFGKVMLYHPYIKFINIRGVSDLLDDKSKTDGEGGQARAVSNVAAFVFEMLYELDFQKLNVAGIIDTKGVAENSKALPSQELIDATVERIRDLIFKHKIKSAIELMLSFTKNRDKDLYRKILLMANRWNRLRNEMIADILTREQSNIEQNKILSAMDFYLEDLS